MEYKRLQDADESVDEELLGGGHQAASPYVRGRRPVQDLPWAIAFLVILAFFVVGGVYNIFTRNPAMMSAIYDPQFMNDPRNCPSPQWGPGMSRRDADFEFNTADVMPVVWTFLGGIFGTIAVCVLLGFLTLWLTKSHPRAMVFGTIGCNVAIFAGAGGVMCLVQPIAGAIFLLTAFMIAGLAVWARDSLELCARLMKVAGVGMSQNMALVGMSALLQICTLVVTLPFFAFIFFAFQNGHLEAANHVTYDAQRHVCIDQLHGRTVQCCAWVPTTWAQVYMTSSMFFIIWIIMLFYQIRLFTVSGTIAQWYFAPSLCPTSATNRVSSSLKHACGPQFGSVCEASLVLAIVQWLRQEAESQREQGGAAAIMACIISCLASLVERLTNFTTITMSITGKSFMDSASATYDLLTRNMLGTVTVWWMPSMVVNTFAFVLSLALSVLVGGLSYKHLSSTTVAHESAVVSGVVLGFIVFILALSILAFFTGILLNIVDTVFICFAMDCDARTQTRPEVHQVYQKVPSVAKAVEAGCWSAPPPPYTPMA